MIQQIDLNDQAAIAQLDKENMLVEINSLPDQLKQAWDLGKLLELPGYYDHNAIILAGMGGSAIGADLVVSLVRNKCRIPLIVQREYDLPAWAMGKKVLAVVSSHSGNTEESLAIFESAKKQNCQIIAICTGGKLEQLAVQSGILTWKFSHSKQPRAAVGFSFGLQLALLYKLGLIADQTNEIASAVKGMKDQQSHLTADILVHKNPAKRLAGQMLGRLVTIVGAEILAPVARRWSTQINELAKSWSQFEFIPELNHNSIAGTSLPVGLSLNRMVMFLKSSIQFERNQNRISFTMQRFLMDGVVVDSYEAKGNSAIEQLWTALHFGDYVAYYLAMLNGIDPTSIEAIAWLKQKMQNEKIF